MIASGIAKDVDATAFVRIAMEEIVANPLAGESAQARLKQIGLLAVLAHMHTAQMPLTIATITDQTGLSRGGVYESLGYLLQRGLLREEEIKKSLGRGKARRFILREGAA